MTAPLRFAALALFAIFMTTDAYASSVCNYYRKSVPRLYNLLCSKGRASSKPAGANSSFSAAFNLTAASLPTEPTSYGLETIGSVLRDGESGVSPTFSLVKGFSKFGTGISTGSNNTFYGDDVHQRQFGTAELRTFEPMETARGSGPNLNLGSSFNLTDPRRAVHAKLGTSIRYNRISDSWGGGPALALASTHLTLGAAVTRERVSNELPRLQFTNYQISTRLWVFELEYNQLRNDSHYNQSPIHILTLTTSIRALLLTVAQRQLVLTQVDRSEAVVQHHFALQYQFSTHFSAGAMFNYIPGAVSLGAQVFL